MNYELAKELKEAGYPIQFIEAKFLMDKPWEAVLSPETEHYGYVFPTLEELMLEVYKFSHEVRLETLRDNPGVWAAATCWGNGYDDDWQKGATPVEAMANLWLSLSRENAKAAQ